MLVLYHINRALLSIGSNRLRHLGAAPLHHVVVLGLYRISRLYRRVFGRTLPAIA